MQGDVFSTMPKLSTACVPCAFILDARESLADGGELAAARGPDERLTGPRVGEGNSKIKTVSD